MKKMNLTTKILTGLCTGVAFGIALNLYSGGGKEIVDAYVIDGLLRLTGGIFINAIKMLVVPLVFVSLVCGAADVGDVKKIGRMGGKTLGIYMATTGMAVTLALILGKIFNPGVGLDLSKVVSQTPKVGESLGVVDIILNMVPRNPVMALAKGEMLPIIVFALFTGISIAATKGESDEVLKVAKGLNAIVMKMVSFVMCMAPIGVFSLISRTFATAGTEALLPLMKFVGVTVFALGMHVLITYMGMLKVFGRLSLKTFMKNYIPAINVAFSTSSSGGTLPVSLDSAKKCGVSESVASFTLPLGATVNMDGTAIMQGVAVIFIAQVYGIDLTFTQLVTVVFTAILASVGTAGVPGVGMITLSMVIQSVGLPMEGVALIMGVDRIIDMFRTVVNILGDGVCTLLVAKSEGELCQATYSQA